MAYIDSEWDTLDRRISTDVARQAREQALEREARRERVRLAREKRERLERERKGMENDNEPVPENEGVPFGRGDSTVEAVDPNDGGDLAQPRSSSQVTVIDLETKVRMLFVVFTSCYGRTLHFLACSPRLPDRDILCLASHVI